MVSWRTDLGFLRECVFHGTGCESETRGGCISLGYPVQKHSGERMLHEKVLGLKCHLVNKGSFINDRNIKSYNFILSISKCYPFFAEAFPQLERKSCFRIQGKPREMPQAWDEEFQITITALARDAYWREEVYYMQLHMPCLLRSLLRFHLKWIWLFGVFF